ncbi:ABC transporter permease [Dolosigranulum savutiense]|uniref:ABC transporter permease n=1 Tax=Dolosigranulum savutiense TaxID=3110288 RepID=A0AB74TXE4_9LACT
MTLGKFAFKNIKERLEHYMGYWLSCVTTVFIFFIFSMNQYHPELNQGPGAIATIMQAAQLIVLIFAIFFLSLSINAFLTDRKKDFGVLLMMGMSKRSLRQLILFENMLLGLTALGVGIGLGLIFGHLLILMMGYIIRVSEITYHFPAMSIVITVSLFSLIFLLLAVVQGRRITKQSIYDLMRVDTNEYEQVIYSKPLAYLGVISLMSGYLIANISLINRLFGGQIAWIQRMVHFTELHLVIGGLVTIGMFLLFSQFFKYFMDVLRRNKSFYFSGLNALWIAELKYRLSSNAVTMFVAALLLSSAFVTTIGTISLIATTEEEVSEEMPYDLMYYSDYPNNKLEAELTTVRQEHDRQNLPYTERLIRLYYDEVSEVRFISQTDYNDAVSTSEQLQLSIGEVALIEAGEEGLNEQLRIAGETLTVTDTAHQLFDSYRYNKLFVVNDASSLLTEQFLEGQAYLFHYEAGHDQTAARQISASLRDKLGPTLPDGGTYLLASKIERIDIEIYSYQLLTYVGSLLSFIFMVASGSLIYFRLLKNISRSKQIYTNLFKLGLDKKALWTIQLKQFRFLFFAPVVMAFINCFFAINMLQELLHTSIWTLVLMIGFTLLALQFAFYYFAKEKLKEKIMLQIG